MSPPAIVAMCGNINDQREVILIGCEAPSRHAAGDPKLTFTPELPRTFGACASRPADLWEGRQLVLGAGSKDQDLPILRPFGYRSRAGHVERGRGNNPMFLQKFWYVAGWSHQVTEGQIVARTIGETIVLYRTSAARSQCLRTAAATGSRRYLAVGLKAMIYAACITASNSRPRASVWKYPAATGYRKASLSVRSLLWSRTVGSGYGWARPRAPIPH